MMNNLQVKRKYKQPLPRLPSKKGKKNKNKITFLYKKKGLLAFKSSPSLFKKQNTIKLSPIELVGLCRFSPSYFYLLSN